MKRRLVRESGNISEIIPEVPAEKAPVFHRPFGFSSYSQHNEDLLVDLIFESKRDGFYVDVGANDPVFKNNTRRFYLRDWRGVECRTWPSGVFKGVVRERPKDINLNVAIGPKRGNMTFYHVADESTLSSFDKVVADGMAAAGAFDGASRTSGGATLRDMFEEHAQGRRG